MKQPEHPPTQSSHPLILAGILACLALIVMGFMIRESPLATWIIVADGALTAVVWVAAIGLGWWVLSLLRLSDTPLRWQIIASAGIGIGGLSLLILLLGSLGILQRLAWAAILGLLVMACAARAGLYAYHRATRPPTPAEFRLRPSYLLWLPTVVFLTIALLEATIPPGLSWGDEARGYDVLEYHFGGPKEYWLAGRVTPLPHNLYTFFPSNAEMLYLLAFVLKGGPFDGIGLAQLLNASLAIWTAAAMWLAGRELGRVPGIVAGVLAATCPWLTYLSGVAYVENGQLFATALSLAIFVRLWVNRPAHPSGWLLLAGLSAGLACGFKYTAVPMVAVPLALIALWIGTRGDGGPMPHRRWMAPLMSLLLFTVGTAITFSPWLVRNLRAAGNPVFPLAHQTFGYRAGLWSPELAQRWDRAHSPPPQEARPTERLRLTWGRFVAEPKFGPALFLLGLLALPAVLGPRRGLFGMCLVIAGVQLAVWLTGTHLYARFAVPIIPTLALLGACGWDALSNRRGTSAFRIVSIAALLLGVGVNLVYAGRLYYDHTRDADGRPLGWFGVGLALAEAEPINQSTPEAGTVVWMVGEARAFYVARPCYYHVVFSRNPLADFAATHPTGPQLARWFRERGVTHVYINWSEIARFRRPGNYGWHASIDEKLFQTLRDAGARLVCSEKDARSGKALYELLEVPHE